MQRDLEGIVLSLRQVLDNTVISKPTAKHLPFTVLPFDNLLDKTSEDFCCYEKIIINKKSFTAASLRLSDWLWFVLIEKLTIEARLHCIFIMKNY